MAQRSEVTADGLRLAVHDWGGSGDPVLLAHPTGFHGLVWAPVARRLVDAGRHVWSFDFRGHGDSDPAPEGRYDWSGFAADVLAVTDRLGLAAHPHLLAGGHSKGGAALLRAEIDTPGTYARIWAYEPIVVPFDEPFEMPADNQMSVGARKRRAVWDSLDEAFEAYTSKPPLDVLARESLRAYVDGGLRERRDGHWELKCRPEYEARIYMTGGSSGIYPRLPEVRCLVRVVCGDPHGSPPATFGELIVARLPHGEFVRAERLGHFGPLEDPDWAARSMLEFAARV